MNESYLNSVRNTVLSSKPSTAIRLLLMVLFVSISPLVSFGQCSYPAGATSVGTYTFCIDNSNTISTATVKAGQYALVNVVKGFTYTFSVGDVFTTTGNKNEILSLYDASNVGITVASGSGGASITSWVATYSGLAQVLLSRGGSAPSSCVNDGSDGGTISLTLNSLNNTQDSQTAFGTNTWIGHIYNSIGTSPTPFTNANYAGYYIVGQETINEDFGGDTACFPIFSDGTQRASIYTQQFGIRYRMKSTRAAGYYFMNANADDGIRVTVDGVMVLNDWSDHPNYQYCNNLIYLNGNSDIIVEYYENSIGNEVGFNLAPITGNTISSYADRNVCSGVSPGNLDGSNILTCINNLTTYQWQSSTDNVNFTNISGATAEDYTPPTVTTTTVDVKFYRRVLKALGVAITASNPATGSVKVTTSSSAPGTPGAITGSATQCAGNTLQTYSVGAVANATSYNWTLPANWTITAGAGTNSITVSIASNGATGNVSVNAINGCGIGYASSEGSGYKWVVVSSPTVAGTITPANTNVCLGSNSTNLSLSGQTGSVLRWESSTDNFATAATPIVNTSTSLTASGLTTDTYYRAVVQSGGCNVLNTSSVKLTVVGAMANPGGISINGVSYPVNGSTTNCASTTMTYSIASVANATSYTWTVGTGWTIVSGQGTATVSVTTGNTSQSNNISVYATNGTCPQTGSTYLYVTLTNTAAPTGIASQSFCSSSNPTVANLTATGTAINWYSAASGGSALATTTALVNGTHYYATQTVSGCESTTRFDVTATIIASPAISGTVTPATCSNGSDGAITVTGLNVPIEFKKADNDNIDLGSKLLSNRNAFTVEGWVKFNLADVGSRMSLFGQNDVIEFFLDTNTILLWTPGGGSVSTPLTAAIGNNAWHHIAATGDGTNLRIYIDGGLVATGGSTTTNYGNSTAYNAQIGSGVVDPLIPAGGGFTGQIGKVGFYNTALAAGTISTLATSPTTYLGTETGLIAAYNFFEGSGTTLTSLPAGTNGTFGNSPQWIYTYSWTKSGTAGVYATTKNISGLSPGDYNLTVTTLGTGCPVIKTFTVGSTNPAPSTPTVTPTQPTCTVATGTITVNTPAPATGITYTVTGTNPVVAAVTNATGIFSGLSAGIYNVTSTNPCGTSSETSATLALVKKTWNGTTWSGVGNPTADENIEFAGNYSVATDVTACSCTVTSGTVTIPAGNYLKLGAKLTVNTPGTLTFENNASLVQTAFTGANAGNVTYKRATTTIRELDFTYWSSPVAGQNLLAVSPTSKSDKFFSFNPTTDYWVQETPSTTTMTIGKGYIIRGVPLPASPPPSFPIASFYGVPNNGDISITVVGGQASNLIGNPYPSAIYADQFLYDNRSKIDGTIYFWTHNTPIAIGTPDPGTGVWAYSGNDYATYSLTGGVGTHLSTGSTIPGTPPTENTSNRPTGIIAAGQSFFTTSTTTGGAVKFTNTMRVDGSEIPLSNSNFYKTTNTKAKTNTTIEKNRVWLNLTNKQGAFKQTLVGYVTGATNTWDNLYDGESFDGNDFLDFYSINEEKNLTIQGRALPFDENDEIPLGYRIAVEGTFTINIDETDGLLANQSVFIEDKLTNTIVDLKKGNYTFNTAAGTFNDRLVLRYSNKTLGTGDFDIANNKVVVSVKNKQIKINSVTEPIDKIIIYDLSGKLIYQKKNISANEFFVADFISDHQTLIVKTILQNGTNVSDKIIY